jgi:formiminoglutamase
MSRSWPNLSDLLVPASAPAPIGLVGAPLAAGSVTPGRCNLAPAALRRVLARIGLWDGARELASPIADHGDVLLDGLSIGQATDPVAQAVAASVSRHALTLVIGGNNAVTRPAVLGLARSLALPLDRVGLLTLDAHFDMRDLDGGLSNGNPVRALRDDGLPGRNIAQLGLAPFANSRAMAEDARTGGHLVIALEELLTKGVAPALDRAFGHLAHCDAIAVDCDIDVIDRAQFPAAPGGRAGGLPATAFFAAVRALAADARVRLIDLTEWDPPLDPGDLSALTAGRWLAEVIAGFEAR